MQLKPNAKINLGLNILRKRTDGFHDLESIFLPVPWEDNLDIEPSNTFSFESGGRKITGDPEQNLCVKAFNLLQKEFDLPQVRILLEKNIPMGAGLGGGSSDAAFTLKGLNQLFKLGLSTEQLEKYAAELGSDCPFFIQNIPALANGRGEKLDCNLEVKLKAHLLLVKPDVFIGTKEAYSRISPQADQPSLKDLIKEPKTNWKTLIKNDFEKALFPIYPELQSIKQQLYEAGAFYAAMSGSGSCLYGLFEEKPDFSFPQHTTKLLHINL